MAVVLTMITRPDTFVVVHQDERQFDSIELACAFVARRAASPPGGGATVIHRWDGRSYGYRRCREGRVEEVWYTVSARDGVAEGSTDGGPVRRQG